jgi:hypothetical protein
VASVCRNTLTCFKYSHLGHKSTVCRSITLIPSSSSPPQNLSDSSFFSLPPTILYPSLVSTFHSVMASHSRVLRFLENDLSAKTEEDLSTRVILGIFQGDLLASLKVCFPCGGHH